MADRARRPRGTRARASTRSGRSARRLVTRDEIADPQALDLWLDVDGRRYQSGNTRTMVFTVARLIAYLSRCMSLQPGDVISTGTPPGVGMGVKPSPVYLKPGQTVRCGVAGLGEQQQRTRAAA